MAMLPFAAVAQPTVYAFYTPNAELPQQFQHIVDLEINDSTERNTQKG